VPAKMRANETFSDASLEELRSVSVNTNRVMSPSDVVDLESPLYSVKAGVCNRWPRSWRFAARGKGQVLK